MQATATHWPKPLPATLVWRRLAPGVYDSACGRVTLYRIEGCYPAAWNAEWNIDYQNWLAETEQDYSPYGLACTMLAEGVANYRSAKAFAAEAWAGGLRARCAAVEARAAGEGVTA